VIRASCNIEETLRMPDNTKEMPGHARHHWKDVERCQVALGKCLRMLRKKFTKHQWDIKKTSNNTMRC
jgi:hypothetical protein